jgi:hypothetical protein
MYYILDSPVPNRTMKSSLVYYKFTIQLTVPLVTSIPSLGPVQVHLQYLLMQVAEHKVTNANCELGEGYRIVFLFHCLRQFQQSRAMVRGSYLFASSCIVVF